MARELRWWIAIPLLACAVLAFAYLPPRATPLWQTRFRVLERPTPYRSRVQELADEWRSVTLERQLLDYRERLRPELQHRRALEVPGPALLFTGSITVSDSARRLVRAILDTAWARMGIGIPKVSVGVVLDVGWQPVPDLPSRSETIRGYLLPDSSDRSTCLVFLSARYWAKQLLGQPRPRRSRDLEAFLHGGIGPCAFFAAFGTPGREIRRWLGAREFDLATMPWGRRGRDQRYGSLTENLDPRIDPMWFWFEAYSFPTAAVACIAGRSDGCRTSVLTAASTGPPPRLLKSTRWWQHQALAGGEHYLADVVEAIGRERFRQFWNSEEPVDTALAIALRAPVGTWTRDWQAGFVPPIRLGPAVSVPSAALGLLLGALALGMVVATVRRREVR
jgi:hypothetical protein